MFFFLEFFLSTRFCDQSFRIKSDAEKVYAILKKYVLNPTKEHLSQITNELDLDTEQKKRCEFSIEHSVPRGVVHLDCTHLSDGTILFTISPKGLSALQYQSFQICEENSFHNWK